MSATAHLVQLRAQLQATLDARGLKVVAQSLAQLDSLNEAEAPDPVLVVGALEQLEDLVEALMHESGWVEARGGET